MGKIIYDALKVLFDGSLITDVQEWMDIIINGLISIFNNVNVSEYFTIFSAAAASLMIIFFFIDLMDSASKDMITLERLVTSFVKLLLGFLIMMYLPEILNGLFGLVGNVYEELGKASVTKIDYGITFWGSETFPSYEKVGKIDIFDSEGNMFDIIMGNFSALLTNMIVFLVGNVGRVAAYLITVTNALSMVTRGIFAPLAVAQCFEDGQRSNAIRYLKKFAADGLTFAIIVGILYAGSLLLGNITTSVLTSNGITNIDGANALVVLSNWKIVAAVLVVNLSVVGAAMKANGVAQDVIGAH